MEQARINITTLAGIKSIPVDRITEVEPLDKGCTIMHMRGGRLFMHICTNSYAEIMKRIDEASASSSAKGKKSKTKA